MDATRHRQRNSISMQSFIALGDYMTCGQRYGANEYFANNLYLNNNLFSKNIASLKYVRSHTAKISKCSIADSPIRKSKFSHKEPQP